MSAETEKRKLNDLKVVELKAELEKRGKETSGVKNVLIERLSQVNFFYHVRHCLKYL